MRSWVVGLAVASQAVACGESSADREAASGSGATGGVSTGGTTGGSGATGGGGSSGGSLTTGGGSGAGGSIATGGGSGSGGSGLSGGGGSSGGSLATGGRSGTGGAMAAGSSGIAGSPGGGSGGKSNYGNPLPNDRRCDEFAERVATACPDAWTYEASHFFCQEGLNQFYPVGCEPEFAALIECEGEIDCDAGFSPSCPVTHVECSNDFVMQTQCVREGAGVTCPEGTFAFVCRSAPPPACTQTEGLGSASRACCPPFQRVR
jgi:hypothetical protein